MDELTTSIVGIDFPNEDKSKSNRRMECMLCAPGDVVELRLEPTNHTTRTPLLSSANAAPSWAMSAPSARR
jgi:hypothetical protein